MSLKKAFVPDLLEKREMRILLLNKMWSFGIVNSGGIRKI